MSRVKKLQREMKANPVKAAGLGVLLLVAGYFWFPLVKGFLGSESSPPSAPVAATGTVPSAPVAETPPVAAKPTATKAGGYDWQRFAQQMDAYDTMRSEADPTSQRDPFQSVGASSSALPGDPARGDHAAEADHEPLPIRPAEVGLVLSSTLIGARAKIAEIGGKSYRVGDRVHSAGQYLETIFRVVEVHPRRVILERNGKRYELKISRPLLDALSSQNQDLDAPAEGDQDADVSGETAAAPRNAGHDVFEKKTKAPAN